MKKTDFGIAKETILNSIEEPIKRSEFLFFTKLCFSLVEKIPKSFLVRWITIVSKVVISNYIDILSKLPHTI